MKATRAASGDSAERSAPIRRLVGAGWTGRDRATLDNHIRDFEMHELPVLE